MHISLHVGGLLMIVKMGRGCVGGSVHPLKIMEDLCNSFKGKENPWF